MHNIATTEQCYKWMVTGKYVRSRILTAVRWRCYSSEVPRYSINVSSALKTNTACLSVTLVSIYLRIYTTPNPEQYCHNRKGPTTLNGEMTVNDWRTKAMEGSGCFKHYYPRICIKGQNAARIADLRAESNPGPPEYEAGVITTRHQRWVGS
jgi:hypothetical protein